MVCSSVFVYMYIHTYFSNSCYHTIATILFDLIGIGGHESTAVLLLGTFELSNLIVIKKLFLKSFFLFLFLNYTIFECQLKFNV